MIVAGPFAAACVALVVTLAPTSCAIAAQDDAHPLRRIDRARLCVTTGAVAASPGGRLAIETPSVRATVRETESSADQIAELRFQYLGPSRDTQRLASGAVRRQIGVKLRAEDGCNLIYAMWRIEPEARIVVSIKRNPGQRVRKQCGARGYLDFKPQGGGEQEVRPGESHTLRAALRGHDLTVTADGKVVWHGSLGSVAALPVGPPGLRADNGRFIFEYFGSASAMPGPAHNPKLAQVRCRIAGED
jgi:hypothetical protein